jgi:hypothetical protein
MGVEICRMGSYANLSFSLYFLFFYITEQKMLPAKGAS